ncbi:branched-chain amino acid ABC transporter permease [Microbaculum marinisediminis]|uniref:Branched-chain amino acid ABC transporter permease n=1 Tax=Microbaculum marinisediminis TaxID=2931392 RepID=A0AAW5R3D7_9HYPH|nr:branched-chain amino acid ABC transporter permease [Microbaculum sp. A6E488]MCT8974732.1 branched-chain amino acid ABC transporter permease [Microbaculum sp. A6E488]
MPMRYEKPFLVAGLILLLAFPFIAEALGNAYFTSTVSRILIFAIAAISLDLILGFGGLVSFGHAAYLGIGAYVVAILSFHAYDGSPLFGLPGTESGHLVWPLAVLISALVAVPLGALCLRTSGVYFIMITLAFAQMLFFFFVSLQRYGGDDGLFMFAGRSEMPFIDLENDTTFYYVCLGFLVAFFLLCRAIVASRFGRVLRGIKQNERRMVMLGYPVYRYKLVAFVIAGAGAGLAGALLANHTKFVSPDILAWTKSGDIMIMVILGGIGTLTGPILGAAAFLMLEDYLPVIFGDLNMDLLKDHWRVVFGPMLILIVLFAKRGLHGMLFRKEAGDD